MKSVFLAGVAIAMLSSGMAFAQNGQDGYTDDVYYNASRAEQDAEDATNAAAEQQYDSSSNYYNSSGAELDGYTSNNHVYNQNAYDSNGYIDYDDDDYASRIRRFYYPMPSVSYWGGIYDPFWASPYYGWYSPGISFSFGWNPYWASGWNSWYGYGYSPYYSPFYYPNYGYGWGGYGMGFWNGYYAGLYNGGLWGDNNPYARRYTYAPRGMRHSGVVRSVGNYGVNSRTSPINRTNNTVSTQRATARGLEKNNSRVVRQRDNNSGRVEHSRIRLGNTRIYNNNAPVSGNNAATVERNRGNTSTTRRVQRQSRPARIFNHAARSNRSETHRSSRSYSPPQRSSRAAEPVRRSFTPSHSSRSYSPPARSYSPSRSSSRAVRSSRR